MYYSESPASIRRTRSRRAEITANNFRDVVALHGLLGGGRFGHIGVVVVLRRAREGGCQSHDGAVLVVARAFATSSLDARLIQQQKFPAHVLRISRTLAGFLTR